MCFKIEVCIATMFTFKNGCNSSISYKCFVIKLNAKYLKSAYVLHFKIERTTFPFLSLKLQTKTNI